MPPLFPLVCFFLLATVAASQEFTYVGFGSGGGSPNLTLNGVTELRSDGTLHLTNETSRLFGHAFYSSPLRLLSLAGKNATVVSFSMVFAFTIVSEYPKLGGQGFAFVAATDPRIPGALQGQYLGLLSATNRGNATNHLFAIEFDTVQDFEFDDINDNHIGVDLNSLASDASASATPVNLKSGDTILAWVDYNRDTKLLNASIATSTSDKPPAPLISFPIDSFPPSSRRRLRQGSSAPAVFPA